MKLRKSIRNAFVVPLFAVFASVAACSGQAPTNGTETAATTNAVSVAAQQAEAPRADHDHEHGHMRHGPAGLLFTALHAPIGLSDAQRATIQSLVDGLKPNAPDAQKAEHAQHAKALADAIRAGNVDVAALTPSKGEAPDHAAHEAALADALTKLHDTLTPDQRTALVAAMQRHEGKEHGDKSKMEKKHERRGPMQHLLGSLDLTDAQKSAIDAKLAANAPAPPTEADIAAMKAKHEAMKKEMEAKLQTFTADTFDAKAFLARPADAPKFEEHAPRMLKELSIVVPMLTPAQREALATKIEQGPAMHGPMAHAK